MSLSFVRPFYHGPNIAVSLARPCGENSCCLFFVVQSERSSFSRPALGSRHSTIHSFWSNSIIERTSTSQSFWNASIKTSSRALQSHSTSQSFWRTSISESSSRALQTCASLAKSRQRTTRWDEAADAYFSEASVKEISTGEAASEGELEWRAGDSTFHGQKDKTRQRRTTDSSGSEDWERSEKEALGNRSKVTPNGARTEGARWGEAPPSGRELNGSSEGVKRWGSPANREHKDFGGNSGGYEGGRSGRPTQWQKSGSVERERRDQWQKPSTAYRSREEGAYKGRSGHDSQIVGKRSGNFRREEYGRGSERDDFRDEWRWQSKEYTPPLHIEGQALYGVAPIISALQVCRRKLHLLYMQENLLQNIEKGKRKDKAAVSFIEKTVKSMGVTVKEASKHDLNMLVDNRPHQGLVLDASPLELVQVDVLDAPLYQDGKPPVWVALDEVTDPQNFGAVLRSAYFLGAEGVVVCAKNSAPLSGVVSKASAGAMEVMEVQSCRNMVKFLDRCKETGWRVVGASAEPASVPIRELQHGVATILVLGNEGKGLRTNVKRACDQLVSIGGVSKYSQPPSNDLITDFVAQDLEEVGLDLEDEDEEGVKRGAELSLISGPSAVDSLNVSVAAGIMLYELLDSPVEAGGTVRN